MQCAHLTNTLFTVCSVQFTVTVLCAVCSWWLFTVCMAACCGPYLTIQFISQSRASARSVKYTVHNPSHSTLPTICSQCAWPPAVDLVPRLAVSTSPRCHCKHLQYSTLSNFCAIPKMLLEFKIHNNVVAMLHPQVKVRYQRLPDGEEEKDIMIVWNCTILISSCHLTSPNPIFHTHVCISSRTITNFQYTYIYKGQKSKISTMEYIFLVTWFPRKWVSEWIEFWTSMASRLASLFFKIKEPRWLKNQGPWQRNEN